MAKPTTAPTPAPKYDGPPVKRIRAIQNASNDYTLVEETFSGPPASVRVIKEHCARISAEDRARLYNEEWLGPNRFGSSGL